MTTRAVTIVATASIIVKFPVGGIGTVRGYRSAFRPLSTSPIKAIPTPV
jgi:hypothetical protein